MSQHPKMSETLSANHITGDYIMSVLEFSYFLKLDVGNTIFLK
jgi:hypothetical protein